tara:strand:- start:234 stop:413 length:180 start_codon:yes stop_codon:yes gene_type:complete
MNVPFAHMLQIGREVCQLSSCLEERNYTLLTLPVLPTACSVIVGCAWGDILFLGTNNPE